MCLKKQELRAQPPFALVLKIAALLRFLIVNQRIGSVADPFSPAQQLQLHFLVLPHGVNASYKGFEKGKLYGLAAADESGA